MKPYALILSNDIADTDRMLEVNSQVRDYVDGVKVGVTSSMLPGVGVFRRTRNAIGSGTVLLADYKVADIGFQNGSGNWSGTNEKIVRTLAQAGADYITCHTFPGISSIEESVATAHKYGAKVLTLPDMTHEGANLFFGMPLDRRQKEHVFREVEAYGLPRGDNPRLFNDLGSAGDLTGVILALGEHFCVDGYIGPANDPEVLDTYREFTKNEIWCPGFGRQDKDGRDLETQIRDWAQVVGPSSAMIVGSLIYKAEDPRKAAREIMELRDRVVRGL